MRAALLLMCWAAVQVPATALAWSPLRAENPSVKKGNALMAEERYDDALGAYDDALRELPAERGVQLNRGLALLAQDLGEPSKEAFNAAADPSAPPEIRADAYYNLGIAHAREGESLSEQEDFEAASTHFREAAEAFKRSLRTRPGNRDAAWNLEYALKRILEEEQKQQQQEQQQEQQHQDDQDEPEEQGQDQEQPQDQGEDQQRPEDRGEEEEQRQDQGQEQEQPENEGQDEQEGESESETQDESQPGDESERGEQQPEQPMPPSEVERFLDALEENEQSLPLQRARRRSAGRRPPEKDW